MKILKVWVRRLVKWIRGFALCVALAKDGWRSSRLSGLLTMKRKKRDQWAYCLAVKMDEFSHIPPGDSRSP